jgi:hypothetical protein
MTVVTARLPVRSGDHLPLGRHVEHDSRSRLFDVASRGETRALVPKRWNRISPIFDQHDLGSCTGMAMAGWLGSSPHCGDPNMFRENEACWIYAAGTRLDAFSGEWPPTDTGSSGLGVCKAARMMGMIKGWTQAFTTDAMLQALMTSPVIIGSIWTDGMFTPDADGEVKPTGTVAGGHEYLCRGWDGQYLWCDNSWGTSWGPLGGSFRLSMASWETLRGQQADVIVPHA